MSLRNLLLVTFTGLASARFGEEQVPIPAIQAVTSGGAPGEAATIAGAAISDILAASNACAKLQRADEIINKLGNGADSVKAAIGMVSAEKNFNPFESPIPTVCADKTLPKHQELRGITPLIDPAVKGSAKANALSKKTVQTPLNADGKSVADLLVENGFSNFTSQDASGKTFDPAKGASSSGSGSDSSATINLGDPAGSAQACGAGNAGQAPPPPAGSNGTAGGNGGNNAGASGSNNSQVSSIAGADFGKCVPTMEFVGGLNGRPADEFTFEPIDPLVAEGQQEALNPNIITNRICDQLTNVCNANAKAKSVCADAQTKIEQLGTQDASTARTWNALLGFKGADINPTNKRAISFRA